MCLQRLLYCSFQRMVLSCCCPNVVQRCMIESTSSLWWQQADMILIHFELKL